MYSNTFGTKCVDVLAFSIFTGFQSASNQTVQCGMYAHFIIGQFKPKQPLMNYVKMFIYGIHTVKINKQSYLLI